MSTSVAAGAALGAAALFAVSSAVQSRALTGVALPRATGTAVGGSRALTGVKAARQVLSSTQWLVGTAIAGVAFALHAVALHQGDLSVVQPLLVTMVLFALPASRAAGGPRVTGAEIGWALVLVCGLAAFFAAADPAGRSSGRADRWPAVVASVMVALTIAVCLAASRHRPGGQAAALLGTGAGVAFAGVAALVKSASGILGAGVGALAASWEPYAVVVVGLAGIVLSQLAYRAGPLAASVPAMNSVNPVASVLIGVTVFDERLRTNPLASTVEVVALGAVTVATILLSRLPRHGPTRIGEAGPGS